MDKSLQIEISATFLKNSRCKVETINLNREWTLIMQKWVFLTPDEMKPPLDWVMRGGTPEGGQQAWRCFETLMRGIQGDLPGPTTRNQMENPDVLDISCRDEVHLYRCQQEPMPPLLPTLWLCERSPEFRLNPGNGVVGKTTNWLKNTCFEWENSDLTKSVFKTVRITFCCQAEWGHEMKIKLSYKKRNECMTCENSSATRVLSLHVSLSAVIQLRNLAPCFFIRAWKVVTKECFAVSTEVILREQDFAVTLLQCHIVILWLLSMTHKHPPHPPSTSGSTDGLRCISQMWAGIEGDQCVLACPGFFGF